MVYADIRGGSSQQLCRSLYRRYGYFCRYFLRDLAINYLRTAYIGAELISSADTEKFLMFPVAPRPREFSADVWLTKTILRHVIRVQAETQNRDPYTLDILDGNEQWRSQTRCVYTAYALPVRKIRTFFLRDFSKIIFNNFPSTRSVLRRLI